MSITANLMANTRTISEIRLVNGSTGDPVLYIDYPGKHNALLFDAGDLARLDAQRLADLEAVFISHHHIDHFVGFDRILRYNLDCDKTLHVFGPVGTIAKIQGRIQSYDIQFFPFQKIVFKIHEIHEGRLRCAILECRRRFADPHIEESDWKGPVVFSNECLRVEAAPAEHTVPCLAFALVEKAGYHPDPVKLQNGLLRPGPWVEEALRLLRDVAAAETPLDIQGGRYLLGVLGEQYFEMQSATRVAYVTDTLWSDKVRGGLLKLASRAQRLYCDCYYAHAQLRQAQTHRHMTATQAGEFARQAHVQQLVLMHFAGRYKGRYEDLVDEARAVFPRVTADLSFQKEAGGADG